MEMSEHVKTGYLLLVQQLDRRQLQKPFFMHMLVTIRVLFVAYTVHLFYSYLQT